MHLHRLSPPTKLLAVLCAAFALSHTASQAQTKPLNDTGITFCGAATTGNNKPCLDTDPAGQDKHYGRDAAAQAGTLTKIGGSAGAVGGGANGFDYSKIANNGTVLPASAALGSGPSDWACTRDNLTGLIWEVKTTSGLRHQNNTYTWYMTVPPDGNSGTANGGTCNAAGRCDTEKFVADVNAVGLCGYTDWRMPKVKELVGIADLGRSNPAIDPTYFPNTLNSPYWSGSPLAGSPGRVWVVSFFSGIADTFFSRSNTSRVRLVRGGQ
jgi:Protein of unknown function (DUF1566)